MDGQYVGTMGNVHKGGADKIAGQQWQYATADTKAQRDAIGKVVNNKLGHVRHVRQKLTFLSPRTVLKGCTLNPLTPRDARCPTLHSARLKSVSAHRFD